MKLLTYSLNGSDRVGVLDEKCLNIYTVEKYSSMQELIESGISTEELMELIKQHKEPVALANVVKRPPIPHPKQDIICLGWNYSAHKEESVKAKGINPGDGEHHAIYFGKRVSATTADGDIIPGHWDITENSLDYETELALIIGKDAYRVPKENAYDHVFGYTVFNDVSARNLQKRHQQFYFGKSLFGFCPMGPFIVTEGEFSRPPSFRLRTRVNGELRQDSSTDLMIFDIPHIISELSKGFVLKAGTIIATGTPAGVGMGFTPPKYLRPGDVVECEIDGIGVLHNEVK